MRVLVTGAAGFIGSHLVERLVQDGHEVIGFDNFSTGYQRNLDRIDGEFEFLQGDLRSEDDVRRVVQGVELVYHQGALASVPRSIDDPQTTFAVNVTGTLNLLVAARDAGVRRLVFASSSSVYGDSPDSPKHEGLTPNPLSPYAISKLTGEQLCTVFNDLYDIETVSLRYFNVFGPYQDPDSPYAAVIPKFARALHQGVQPVIYGDGEQTREFTYVDDIVEGNVLAGNCPSAAGEIINISTANVISLNTLLAQMISITGANIWAKHERSRDGDIYRSESSIRLAQELLGFRVSTNLLQGLESTLCYLAYLMTDS